MRLWDYLLSLFSEFVVPVDFVTIFVADLISSSIVRYSGKAMKDVKNTRIRTFGPIGLGLAAVPALPFIFDKPVEEAVEWVFHKGFELYGGKAMVGDSPSTGREAELRKGARKEKEL